MIKWTDKVAAIAAILAVVFSIWSLAQSYTSIRISKESNDISRQSNDIARTAEARNQIQDAQQLKANVEVKTLIARSLELQAEEDKGFWEPAQLAPHVVKTPYWQSERSVYNRESQKGYLFLLIINNGPAMVNRLRFSEMHWYPKQGLQPPTGILMEGDLGILRSEHFYALLLNG